jgi:hypothetical protein
MSVPVVTKHDITSRLSAMIRCVREWNTRTTAPTEKEVGDLKAEIAEGANVLSLCDQKELFTKDELLIYHEAVTHVFHRIQTATLKPLSENHERDNPLFRQWSWCWPSNEHSMHKNS